MRHALAADADHLAVLRARGDRDPVLGAFAPAASPAARGPLFADSLPRPTAARAGRDVDEAPEDRLLYLPHLATAIAGRARRGRRPRLRTVPVAAFAGLEARHRDDSLAALDGVQQLDLDLHPQIGAPHRAAGLAPAEVPAEKRLEEIADPEVAEPAGRRAEHVVTLP